MLIRINFYISSSKSYNLKPTRPSYVSPPRIFTLYHHPLYLKLDPLFCPSLIRTHSKVHFCASPQIIFRGISLSVFLMQKHKRLLSCINSQFFYCSNNQVYQLQFKFSKKLPFRCGIHLLLLARLDYLLYLNFSTQKYSTMANFA